MMFIALISFTMFVIFALAIIVSILESKSFSNTIVYTIIGLFFFGMSICCYESPNSAFSICL